MRAIPKKRDDVISLGTQALAGAIKLGLSVGLLQNTAERIESDLYDLIGRPGDAMIGKQGLLNGSREVLHAARVHRRRRLASAALDRPARRWVGPALQSAMTSARALARVRSMRAQREW